MNAVARKPAGARSTAVTPDSVENGVAPPSGTDWQHERDAGYIWNAISDLKGKVGELVGLVASNQKALEDLRGEIKDIDTDINELQLEQRSTTKTIKVVGFVATPLIAIVAFIAPYFWSNSMRPELERSIAAQVKADIEKEQAAREKTRLLETENAELKAQLKARLEKSN